MKKLLAILLSAVMAMGILAGCGGNGDSSSTGGSTAPNSNAGSNDLQGAYIFLMKQAGQVFYDRMWVGFEAAIKAMDPDAKIFDKSPAENTVTAQLTTMDECLTQKIGALCIATFADTGFDEMNAKYKEAGIPIFSADSRADDEYRITHFNQTDSELLGRYYLWTSILAAEKVDITDDMNVETEAKKVVENHSGDPIVVGLISATPDSPVQLAWHAAIDEELKDAVYSGKVEQDIKYGNDDQVEAANQLNAFLSEGKVDVVFCMSGFGETVSQAAADAGAKIPVVGLALCSNAYEKLPTEDQDTYGDDVIMPFAVLWDLGMNGYGAGAGMVAYLNGDFDGKAGSEYTSVAADRFPETTFKCVDCPMDEGTEVVCGEPLIFTKYNKDTWKDRV